MQNTAKNDYLRLYGECQSLMSFDEFLRLRKFNGDFEKGDEKLLYQSPIRLKVDEKLAIAKLFTKCFQNAHRLDSRESKSRYVWITINPDPKKVDEDPKLFFDVCERYAHLRIHEANIYVFEQRGEMINDYHGVHFHMLSYRKVKPYEFERETHRIFDDFVGDPKNSHQINIQYITQPVCKDKFDYMSGKKKKEKLTKCENDQNFRIQYSLENIYSTGSGDFLKSC